MPLVEIPGPRGRKRFVTREVYKRMHDRGELPISLDFLLWEPESGRLARERFQADIDRAHAAVTHLMGIPVYPTKSQHGALLDSAGDVKTVLRGTKT